MSVTLIFPPATDPRAPMLALPSLAAFLRREGVAVHLMDLDLEGLRFLLRPERLAAAVDRLRSGRGLHLEPQRRTSLLRLAQNLPDRVEEALQILHDPRRFLDGNELSAARAVIDVAVAVASSAAPAPISYSLEPIRYDVAGCDPRRLEDLTRTTGQVEANLFHELWEEESLLRIDATDPILVGVSLTNRQQLLPGLTLARRLKARGHFVVLGGTLITKFADQLERWPEFFRLYADGVVVYEGETALRELVEQLRGGRDFSRVPNYRYLDGEVVRVTAPHVEEVDALPTPDFDGLPLADYLTPLPVLPVLLGKGCYHSRCNFCDIPHINRIAERRQRPRHPATVASDLRRLEARHGARHFVFTDDSLSPAALCQLADALGDDLGRYSFVGYARLEPAFSSAVCRRIADLGVRKLFFGLESASQKTLDHMAKGTRAEGAPAVLRACREAGIGFHLFTMIGLPEEDEESARETLAFLERHRELIDFPGNSFDIHRFGLDVRAPYFAARERLGLAVSPGVLAHELVVSLDHHDWENTRGLSRERIDELLGEFNLRLRVVFERYHNAPRTPWPPYEEHAIFYGERFRDRAFPYATTLPADPVADLFALRLSPACAVSRRGEAVVLISLRHRVELPVRLASALTGGEPQSVRGLVARCGAFSPEEQRRAEELLRRLVGELIGGGILQVEWLANATVGAVGTQAGAAV